MICQAWSVNRNFAVSVKTKNPTEGKFWFRNFTKTALSDLQKDRIDRQIVIRGSLIWTQYLWSGSRTWSGWLPLAKLGDLDWYWSSWSLEEFACLEHLPPSIAKTHLMPGQKGCNNLSLVTQQHHFQVYYGLFSHSY